MQEYKEETFEEKVKRIKSNLPHPSGVKSNKIDIPYSIIGFDYRNMVSLFSKVTFEKDYKDGVCVGWKLLTKESEIKPCKNFTQC